jgi:hypothetical protein
MRGLFGIIAGSKGMVRVPNLIGLLRAQAIEEVENSGLISVTGSVINTSDSALGDKVESQSIEANTLVDYETQVSFNYYNYSVPYSFTPYAFTPYSFVPFSFTPYAFTPYSFVPAPSPEFTTAPYLADSTQSSLTIGWSAINYQSWKLYSAGTGEIFASGNGQASAAVRSGLNSSQTYTQTLRIYSGLNQTGTGASGAVTGTTLPQGVPYSFTPFAFTPYAFTPYAFTPYAFTPYSFTPFSFTPAYSFTPLAVCIDQDTPIQVVGLEGSVELKRAQDISVGDKVWSMSWDQLQDETIDPYAQQQYNSKLSGIRRVQTTITSIQESSKAQTIIFNDDISKRFTLEEKVFIKRGELHKFEEAKDISAGDFIFIVTDNGDMNETKVLSTDIIDQSRLVYKFAASPVDTLIAGNMVVHNSKI